ncbi:MAG: ribosome-recycling factor, partial [Actinomycetota bacterium]
HILHGQEPANRGFQPSRAGQREVHSPGQPSGYAGRVIDDTILEAIDKMERALEHVQSQFSSVRTGRATPSLVDRLLVDYYGSLVPLQQLAGFQVPEARTLIVKPHDRGALAAIEKAIRESDLGLQPSNDGIIIRLSIPVLTEQRRKEYVKIVKNMSEDGRIAVRNIRRDARKTIETAEKNSEISKDELERAEKELEKITHDHVEQIEKAFTRKEHELLEV